MDGTKQTTNWIIAGLVALVVIIGGGWLIARERSGTMAGANATSTESVSKTSGTAAENPNPAPTPSPSTASKPAVSNPTSAASGETIAVADQPAGSSVSIADANLAKPSWIVIRGTNGWALGAAWFYKSGKNLTVPLVRKTVAGEMYQAVIYVDDGNKKLELHGGDTLVTDTQGAPVASTFKAQ